MTPRSTRAPDSAIRNPRSGLGRRLRMVLGLAAVVILFVSMGLNIIPMIIGIPAIGLSFALSLPPDDESRRVRWSVRNLIIGLVVLAAFAVVALLPYETVFLLATVGDHWALAVIAVSAVLTMGLPLALSEMPRPRGSGVLLGRRDAVLALTALVSLAVFHNSASTVLALPGVALILPLVLGAWCVWRGRRGELDRSLWRRPLSKAARPALAQALNRWVFLALAASTIAVGTFSVLQWDLPAGSYGTFLVIYLIWARRACDLVDTVFAAGTAGRQHRGRDRVGLSRGRDRRGMLDPGPSGHGRLTGRGTVVRRPGRALGAGQRPQRRSGTRSRAGHRAGDRRQQPSRRRSRSYELLRLG
jgi:hypothetical protein